MQKQQKTEKSKTKRNINKAVSRLIDALLTIGARILLVAFGAQGISSMLQSTGNIDVIIVIPFISLLAFKALK